MEKQWSISPGLDLHAELDRAGLRRSLQMVLRDAIRSGRLPAGTRLPATRTLAADLGVARGTVSFAYEQLVAEGYLTAKQGSGTRVAAFVTPIAGQAAAGRLAAGRLAAGRQGGRDAADQQASGRASAGDGPASPVRWNLFPGEPDLSTFPRGPWLAATKRVLATCPNAAFGYGDPRGVPALRQALAGYLGRARGVVTSPDQIVVTAGYSHALALLATVLASSGTGRIAFENPSLPHHRRVVARAGLAVEPVRVDQDGIDVDQLTSPAVVVTPAHQYPTGVTLQPARRARLADWARDTGALVVEDDYDGEFRFGRPPVGAVQGLAPDHVAYAGTASKTLAPGLRLAWLALPSGLADAVAAVRALTDRHPSVIDQLVLADMIGSGAYDRHVRQCRTRYRTRRDRLAGAVRQHAPAVTVRGIAAGLHALLELPPGGPAEAEVVTRAAELGIAIQGLAGHWIGRPAGPAGVIVGYASPAAHAFEPALRALTGLLAGLFPRPGRRG